MRSGVMSRMFAAFKVAVVATAVVGSGLAAKSSAIVGTGMSGRVEGRRLLVSSTRGPGAVSKPERMTCCSFSPAKGSPAVPAVCRNVAEPTGKAAAVMNERNGARERLDQSSVGDVADFAFSAIWRRIEANLLASPFAAARWSSHEAGVGAGGGIGIFVVGAWVR